MSTETIRGYISEIGTIDGEVRVVVETSQDQVAALSRNPVYALVEIRFISKPGGPQETESERGAF